VDRPQQRRFICRVFDPNESENLSWADFLKILKKLMAKDTAQAILNTTDPIFDNSKDEDNTPEEQQFINQMISLLENYGC
jgi:hypothetical protein